MFSLFLYFPVEPDELLVVEFVVAVPIVSGYHPPSLILTEAQLILQHGTTDGRRGRSNQNNRNERRYESEEEE